jgi:hypothetical protein
MAKSLAALERRVRTLERSLPQEVRNACNCRIGEQTRYHTALELKEIMDVRCPVHQIRDLGDVIWIPSGLPLRSEDGEFCFCSRSAVREFIQGIRGPLTLAEDEMWERTLQRDYEQISGKDFRNEQARAEALLQAYPQKERKR